MGRPRSFTDAEIKRIIMLRDHHSLTWQAIAMAVGRKHATSARDAYYVYKDKPLVPPVLPAELPAIAAAPSIAAQLAAPIHRPRYFSDVDTFIMTRINNQGLTAGVLGDPPPGRSALDQKQGRGA